MAHGWRDTGLHYGLVTRIFHWSMAAILLWQFSGIVINRLFGRSALSDMLNSTHGELGAAILLLAALRALWGLYNLGNRPKHESGPLGTVARLGHIGLYLLMLFIPAVAFLRAFGSEWGLVLFSVEIVTRGTENIGWMVTPANLLHAIFAWTLLAMIAGHIAMALVPRFVWRYDVIDRMAGKTGKLQAAE